MLLWVSGCGRDDKSSTDDRQAEESAVNEYSYESVFENVLRKVRANPQDDDALYHLADLYDRQGQYEKAVETYKKVIEINPDRDYAYFKMGTAYSRMDRPAEAVEALTEAAGRLPKNPVIWNNLGIAYGKLEKFDREIEALQQALKIRPRYASARFNLAVTYLKKGDTTAAKAHYEELKKTDETMARQLLRRIEGDGGREK